ncbi:hypothetical protein HGRIS_009112 [Hohenbuehelia grisea]|uniref:Transcription elongation factor Eaf N-terminal domain-containing protein n=1 Tax=Hohenbuehelia grisea TaxID=104357 RepID=A0ABR3J0B5_9AGAR
MAAVDNSWMPAMGRHKVNIGSSLGRALKARKGGSAPTTKRSNLPDRDFYSFRYNRKPPSVDTSKPGTIDVNRGKEATKVTVEHPSVQDGETHLFTGTEDTAKEFDCVLIYDEETGTFTLEKLDSYVSLNHVKKVATTSRPRPSASPLPPPPPPVPASSSSKDAVDELEALIEQDLQEGDADGDIDDEFIELLPLSSVAPRQEEEEEEEEGAIVATPPPPPPKPKPKPVPRPSVKVAKPGRSKAEPSAPKATAQPKAKQPAPRPRASQAPPPPPPPITLDVDDEIFEISRPTKSAPAPAPAPPSAKRSQPASAASGGLALPGSTSSIVAPVAPAPVAAPEEDSDEEDWDEVAAVAVSPPQLGILEEINGDNMFGDDVFGGQDDDEDEEMEEIDMNEFEAEMNAEMNADMNDHLDSDDASSMVEATFGEPEPAMGPPKSLNQFAMGALGGNDPGDDEEEEYSSSDDSDDD